MVGYMGKEARTAILGALLLDETYMTHSNTNVHGWYSRYRALCATFRKEDSVHWVPHKRAEPWDSGWRKLHAGLQATMTTFRRHEENVITTSAYQSAPRHCLVDDTFKDTTYDHALTLIKAIVREEAPKTIFHQWDALIKGQPSGKSQPFDELARWITTNLPKTRDPHPQCRGEGTGSQPRPAIA